MFKKNKKANKNIEKLDEKDVGLAQDLSFALKNLIAAEDHCAVSFATTGDAKWKKLNDELRRIRSKCLTLIVKKDESHLWCLTKHILAASMGLQEVANRFNQTNQNTEADFFYGISADMLLKVFELNDFTEQESAQTSA